MKGKSYEKMWSYVPEMLPNESERRELIKLIDRENLIKCYQRGEIQHNIQYSRMSNQNTRIWVSLTINTYLVPETGDIEGFLYAYDITEKKLGEQIIAKLTALGYEELGIIHIPTHSTRIYRIGKRSNDTLELSRIESGKFVLENEPVDSRELGEAVLTALRPSADLKNIHLEAQNFPVETVMVDKLKLHKVLLNLLSNAIKYTPENGKIKMSIDLLDPPV